MYAITHRNRHNENDKITSFRTLIHTGTGFGCNRGRPPFLQHIPNVGLRLHVLTENKTMYPPTHERAVVWQHLNSLVYHIIISYC